MALHEESPPVTRITGVDNHYTSPGRQWGNWTSFSSTQDLTLIGLDRLPGRQIFVWSEGYFDCFNGTTKTCAPNVPPGSCQQTPCPPVDIQAKYLRQLTNGVGDPDNPSIAIAPNLSTCNGLATGTVCSDGNANQVCGVGVPCKEVPAWFLEDRQWVAFDALGSFNGNIGPAATRRQIFMKNLGTGEIRQVTFSGTGDSTRPSIAERGGIVVFQSTASLDGFPNPAGVTQVYIYQRGTGSIRLVSKGLAPFNTIGLGPSRNPHPTETGSGVVFESTADLLGDGHDTGISQIFFAKYDRQNARIEALLQATNGNGSSVNPYIGDAQTPTGQVTEAKKIVFESTASNLPGTMQVPGRSIFEIGIDVSNAVLDPAIAQVTPPAIFGDCMWPSIDASGNRIPMVCTGDPLLNGTVGNRLFVLDRQQNTLYQITGAGDVQGTPMSNLGQWFVVFATTSDLTGAGVCGYQIYIIDYFTGRWAAAQHLGQLPPDAIGQNPRSTIGLRTFEFKESTLATPASDVTSFTSDGSVLGAMVDDGRIGLNIGAPDEFTGEAPITIAKDRVDFPPTYIPGIGAVCIEPTGDGQGKVDCTGNAIGGDVAVAQDHNIDDTDFHCLTGCREDMSCPGMLVGPHQSECPRCPMATGTCDSGPIEGQVCDPDSDCPSFGICNDGFCPIICTDGACAGGGPCVDPDDVCQVGYDCTNDKEPTCNGRPFTSESGTYVEGDMRVTVPVKVSISLDPGPDDVFCSGDPGEVYSNLKDLPATLRLTTATSTVTITDVDNVAAAILTSTETGAPLTCQALRTGDLGGLVLAGHLSTLDASLIPGIRDLILAFHLEAKPGILGSCSPPCSTDAECNDLNVCNGLETCINSHCSVGTPTPCDDSLFCNGTETCDPTLGCLAGPLPTCDDTNTCTTDSCDDTLGCVYTAVPGSCDDGNLCTTGDTCAAGACVGTPNTCVDTDACNGLESCDPGTGGCLPGVPLDCDDVNPCTDDSCDATNGCVHVDNTLPCDDLSLCTDNDVCGGGTCAGTLTPAAALCNAGNGTVCDGDEQCDPLTGTCANGTPLNCDDTNDCTDDFCSSVTGCFAVPNTNPCDDASACTTGDTCAATLCVGVPVICENATVCDGIDTCNPATGCVPGVPLDCDDLNDCTDDSCDAVLGCMHVPNVLPCDDGNECTTGDNCAATLCTGAPLNCENGDMCDGVATCDPLTGCVPGTAPDCDDTNPCTDDSCDSLLGCVHVDNALPCDDASACTENDVCALGSCAGTLSIAALACNAGNGTVCDGLEACNPATGACDAGTPPLTCDDTNTCTDDSCDPLLGCLFIPNVIPCDDGTVCTSADTCTAGSCVGSPVPCDDSNACNGVETCHAVFGCQVGTNLSCNDGDECTADTCDPDLGCVFTGFPNSAVCRLIAVIDAVTETEPELLGGAGVKKRILRKLNAALRSTQKFYTGNPRRQSNNQRRALRRIEGVRQLIQGGLLKGTFDPDTGDELLDLLADAADDLQQAIP